MGTIIDALAAFACDTRYEDLPAEIVHSTKNLLLDSIGCALGAVTTGPGQIAISLAEQLGGPPECAVIGTGHRVSITNAVLANGQLVNALDYDTVMPGGHTPPYIVPTALAAAERADALGGGALGGGARRSGALGGVSGKDLILATAIGAEIGARIATAVPSAMRFADGEFEYAKREGYARLNFGAAAAAGRLHGLGHDQMVNALALSGHLAQLNTWGRGNYAIPRNLSKYGFPGWQNTGAVIAVFFAQAGLMGDVELLDDREHGYGEFSGYDAWDPGRIADGIGERWSTGDLRFKPYACCTMLHRGVECFEAIIKDNGLRPEEIERVHVTASPTVDAALFTDRSLNNVVDVQFGMHYILAMVAHGQRTGADLQDWDKVTDPRVVALADRVTIAGNPGYHQDQLSTVTVTARGREYHHELPGLTEPLDEAQLVAKFRDNAAKVLPPRKVETSAEALVGLEDIPRVADLIEAITI